jgi:predicted small lipoprotein YifL
MRIKFILIIIFSVAVCSACGPITIGDSANNASVASDAAKGATSNTAIGDADKKTDPTPATVTANQPKTIRDFFMLLPEKYFVLEGCVREKDTDCRKAKVDYLKLFPKLKTWRTDILKAAVTARRAVWKWRYLNVSMERTLLALRQRAR